MTDCKFRSLLYHPPFRVLKTKLDHLRFKEFTLRMVDIDSFSGLASLTSLDLSHNNIVSLSPGSLAGLKSLVHLSLSHNYLQIVTGSWLDKVPRLNSLLLMDNDIIMVEDKAFDSLKDLMEVNLAGKSLWPLISSWSGTMFINVWRSRKNNAQLSHQLLKPKL